MKIEKDTVPTVQFRIADDKGRLVQESPKFPTPRTLAFESYDLPISLPAIDPFRGRGRNQRELTLPELATEAYGGGARNTEDRLAAQANLHFRLVETLVMILLPLLSVALAVPPKRSGSSLGIFVGIVLVVAYHKVNQYGEQAGAQGRLDPVLALWVPFFVLTAMVLWMYHVLAHRPGGQPIGALERVFTVAARSVRKLLPKPRIA